MKCFWFKKFKDRMKHRILFIVTMVLLQVGCLQAQTTRNVTLAHKKPFADPLVIKEGYKDQQLTVKLLFNEDSNSLTVTLTSPKTLFVFWDDTRYRDVFSCHRWLETDKLSYVISCNTTDRFRLSKDYHKTLSGHYHFYKWIEVEGLQPVATDLKLVNDSIVQHFTLSDRQATSVTIRLRHVLTMDEMAHKGPGRWYDMTCGRDFNFKYRITLQRNPCLGYDDDVAAAEGALEAIRESLAWFKKKYASGKVADEIGLNDFQELKQMLIKQFPKSKSISPCPEVRKAREQYNAIVDSLQLVNVALDTTASAVEPNDHAFLAKNILANTRMLDNTVSRWLASKDEAERADLLNQCRSIISDTSTLINENHPQTADEQYAVNLFRKAEQYFRKVCK